ncbi:MAG: methyl-accepting chemotaxis protein [Thermodesulfovibrio sp.]|nr:methyl-accepting chemotaxis protein [Thermodesulfovibrio sp.]MCX7724712.1 methyl-accepting chemotaxis protein [Thermodesulfovibrio sp.]MDW7971903.1 methyl-accepting chemotaxis protein [Thermodesulfovibrio sp.]
MPEVSKVKQKKTSVIYRKFLVKFILYTIFLAFVIFAGFFITGYEFFSEDLIRKKMDLVDYLKRLSPFIVVFATSLIGFSIINILWFRRQILSPLSLIEDAIENIRKGNYEKRVRLKTGDEFQKIADTLNQMMDRVSLLMQAEEEKKEMQSNIMKFLQVMTQASEGNFTQRAEITPDVFGSLSDAFNLIADSLSEFVKEVKKSAEDLTNKSETLNDIIQKIQDKTKIKDDETESITSLIEEATEIISKLKDKTKATTDFSKEAFNALNNGNEIIRETVNSMQLVREVVQEISERMKILSEKINDIGTISTLLSDIANRTSLLALNASIEAARAGSEGRGFVVIAEEIKNFSEKTAKSSKNIAEIIKLIQEEVSFIISSVEEEINYAEKGMNTVNQTKVVFEVVESMIKNIEKIAEETNELVLKQKEITDAQLNSVQKFKEIKENLKENLNEINDELTKVSQSLEESSKELIMLTEKFRV